MTLGNSPRSQTMLRLEARKSFVLGLKFLEAVDTETPVDLTGATITLIAAQQSWQGGTVVLTKSVTVLAPATAGLAQLELQALDTDLPAAEYIYTVTLRSGIGFSTVILKGSLEILENPDPSTAGTFPSLNPSTSLAVYLDDGDLVNVYVDSALGLDPAIGASHTGASAGVHGVIGSVVGTSDSQTLTNKTISADNNTLTGFAASSFLLSDATGKADGSAPQKAVPAGTVVGSTDTQTLTNKTLSMASNFINGLTVSKFLASDATGNLVASSKSLPSGAVVGDTDIQTLTNKTLADPTITLGGKVVEKVVVDNTAPPHVEGRIWRDADDTWGRTYISDGAAWQCIGIDVYPECHATKTGDQAIASATPTRINWGAASPNVGSMWPGSLGTLTVPIPGIYAISGQMQLDGSATGGANVAIYINGAIYIASGGQDAINNEVNQKAISLTKKLAANDTIELWGYQNSGGGLNIQAAGGSGGTSLDVILVKAL